jgi:hypothetical protein
MLYAKAKTVVRKTAKVEIAVFHHMTIKPVLKILELLN